MDVGISADDLEYAFEKHATSKIRNADDLETVKSMGFRGEALASIAAISKLQMISKTQDCIHGNRIVIEGGKVLEREEYAAQEGTMIIINNLFFNTPVRYKFLKKDYTELGYIEDVVTRIALANPEIAIKLINENKTIIQTTGNGDLRSVIYSIYGKDIAQKLLDVSYEYDGVKITGVIGRPEMSRANRNYQIFFVNKRYIKDKTLYSAIEQAYKGLLMIGKFAFTILNIEIEPSKIDVNVHPAKLEIRFSEEQKVFQAIYHAVKETLLKGDLVRNAEQKTIKMEIKEPEITNVKINENTEIENKTRRTNFFDLFSKKKENSEINNDNDSMNQIRENTIEEIYKSKNEINDVVVENKDNLLKQQNENINIQKNEIKEEALRVEENKVEYKKENFDEKYKRIFGRSIESKSPKVENVSIFENIDTSEMIPNYKYIGTIFKTYIIIEINEEAYILDQHAAHERVLYEKVKKNYYNETEKDSQIMLLPDIIQLSHKEKAIVKENAEIFTKAGFIFEEFGDNTIKLIGVPNICIELDTKELFKDILDAIGTVAITAIQEKEEKFLSTVACKAAIKANMQLDKEEVDNLMKKLLVLKNPFTCPHGRPTAIKLTKSEIERKFNRT